MDLSHAPPIQRAPNNELCALASLWRGAMLNIHGRIETAVADQLHHLADEGVELPKIAFHEAPAERLRCLMEVLARADFGGHGRATVKWLDGVRVAAEWRNALAHGAISVENGEVIFRWSAYRAQKRDLREVRVSPLEMLQRLVALSRTYDSLISQFGQIRRHLSATPP